MKNTNRKLLRGILAVSATLLLAGAAGISSAHAAGRVTLRTARFSNEPTLRYRTRVNVGQIQASGPRVITQRRSALGNSGYLARVKKGRYPLVNNRSDRTVGEISNYANNYGRRKQVIRSDRGGVTFKTDRFLPVRSGRFELYSPQGLVVMPDGRSAYVSYNATNSNEGNRAVGNLRPGTTQIIKVSLRNHGRFAKIMETGPLFAGGHGQAFSYNPRTRTLWLMNNVYGAADRTGVENIGLGSLRPLHQVRFHLGTILGDNLAFDGRGNAINVDEAESRHTITKLHALKAFRGRITPYQVHLNLIPGIAKAPGVIIQCVAYNPHNGRLYIVSDASIISLPASRLGRLRPGDVKQTLFKTRREFEGLSFDRFGNGYLLSNRSPEILKCTDDRF